MNFLEPLHYIYPHNCLCTICHSPLTLTTLDESFLFLVRAIFFQWNIRCHLLLPGEGCCFNNYPFISSIIGFSLSIALFTSKYKHTLTILYISKQNTIKKKKTFLTLLPFTLCLFSSKPTPIRILPLSVHPNCFYFPGGTNGKEPTCNAEEERDEGSIPGSGRSSGGGCGNPLQDSCPENPIDSADRWATAHRVAKSWTGLKWLSTHGNIHIAKNPISTLSSHIIQFLYCIWPNCLFTLFWKTFFT